MNGDVSLGGDGIISNALVENNVIYDNGLGGGSGINCDGVQDSVIRNNLIYNAHASYPCSNMPRFGTNKVLSIDQIKDLVALVMSPDSPVNK